MKLQSVVQGLPSPTPRPPTPKSQFDNWKMSCVRLIQTLGRWSDHCLKLVFKSYAFWIIATSSTAYRQENLTDCKLPLVLHSQHHTNIRT